MNMWKNKSLTTGLTRSERSPRNNLVFPTLVQLSLVSEEALYLEMLETNTSRYYHQNVSHSFVDAVPCVYC
jgi:hypothetical protein